MAPEIHHNEPYEAKPVDVFSAGVIMFIMATGTHPFNGTATADTKLYKSIAAKKSDVFWKWHKKNLPHITIFDD